MTELKTEATLLSRLLDAAKKELTEEEIRRQRVSFIMGSIGEKNHATRAKVTEILAHHEGRKSA